MVNELMPYNYEVSPNTALHSTKMLSAIDELTEYFQKSIDNNIDDPESYFESHEEDAVKSKLDELHKRVSELVPVHKRKNL